MAVIHPEIPPKDHQAMFQIPRINPRRLMQTATITALGGITLLIAVEPALAQSTPTPEAGQAIKTVTDRILNLIILAASGLSFAALAAYIGMIAIKGVSQHYVKRAAIAFLATVLLLMFREVVIGSLDYVTADTGTILPPPSFLLTVLPALPV